MGTVLRSAIALLAIYAANASAQYSGYTGSNATFWNNYVGNQVVGQLIRDSNVKAVQASIASKGADDARQRASSEPGMKAAAPRFPITATDIRPAGKRDVAEQLAAQAAPAERLQLIKACREIQSTIEADTGFRKNNVAYAMALLLGVSVQVAKGVTLSDEESEQLLRALNDALASLPDYKRMTPEARTRLYDTSLVTGGLIAGIAQRGLESGDAALRDQARAMARDSLAAFGFSL